MTARLFRLGDLAELGAMDEVKRESPALWDMADELREPIYSSFRPIGNTVFALMEGRFEEAERFITEYVPIALRTQHPNWQRALSAHFYDLRRAQGRLHELEPLMLNMEQQDPDTRQVVQAGLAYLYRTKDDSDNAHLWFERYAGNEFTDVPGTAFAMTTMLLAADVAQWFKDERRAQILYDMLLPYAERQVVLPILIVCNGSASRPLGQLAATLGRWEDAERHFECALAFDEKVGARPWLARTQHYYADMLHERGAPGDDEKALALVNRALSTFEQLDMPMDVKWALALKMELQGISSTDFKTSIDAVAYAVQHERPDLRPHAAPDGTVTLLFSDIEGSTPLNERLGDQHWMALLREHNAIVREQIHAHQGFEVKTEGDGFMVAFSSARRALQCAIAIQRAFAERNAAAEEQVPVRIGLHTGEAIEEDGDLFGSTVILASRIAAQAAAEEILIPEPLRHLLSGKSYVYADRGEVALKGFDDAVRLYEVRWRERD